MSQTQYVLTAPLAVNSVLVAPNVLLARLDSLSNSTLIQPLLAV